MSADAFAADFVKGVDNGIVVAAKALDAPANKRATSLDDVMNV